MSTARVSHSLIAGVGFTESEDSVGIMVNSKWRDLYLWTRDCVFAASSRFLGTLTLVQTLNSLNH